MTLITSPTLGGGGTGDVDGRWGLRAAYAKWAIWDRTLTGSEIKMICSPAGRPIMPLR